jgi:predicted ABC-type ATPase
MPSKFPLVNADRLTLSLLPPVEEEQRLRQQPDGSHKSKVDIITPLQEHGYFVILLFVGPASPELSILSVATRKSQGGHTVPEAKLRSGYPRTPQAISMAAKIADMTLMFDNRRSLKQAFSLVRAQRKQTALYDCRNERFSRDEDLLKVP